MGLLEGRSAETERGSWGLRVHRTQADGRHRLRLGIPGSQAETGDEIHRLRARVMRTQHNARKAASHCLKTSLGI